MSAEQFKVVELNNEGEPQLEAGHHVRYWSCTRKRRYASLRLARKGVREVAVKHEMIVAPYHCRFSQGFHLRKSKSGRVRFYDRSLKADYY